MEATTSELLAVPHIVRGRTVYKDGKVVGEKGWGKQARAQYPG